MHIINKQKSLKSKNIIKVLDKSYQYLKFEYIVIPHNILYDLRLTTYVESAVSTYQHIYYFINI